MSGFDASRSFRLSLFALAAVAVALRTIFPTADPPFNPFVGIVWHDEGAWVHNARNRALWGSWSLDAWNPMYIAPVFTVLEYLSFRTFGVGVWQARLVSELAGTVSVVLLADGVRRVAGGPAGLMAGALLATNYVYVMYNRAAIMEGTMVAFMVASWYCYVRAARRPAWGLAAGALAVLGFFTKAAAAFFVAALALEAAVAWLLARRSSPRAAAPASLAVLGGLAFSTAVALVAFVAPQWAEYRFYNWQMSVTRKPSYDVRSLVDRVTWFPVLHDFFTRMWTPLLVAMAAALASLARPLQLRPGERLLILWIVLGTAELLVHDVGNERRFLLFVPPLVALASIVLGGWRRMAPPELAHVGRVRLLPFLPLLAFALYIAAAAVVRVANLYEVRPNVRLAAALAVIGTGVLVAAWPRLSRWLAAASWTLRQAVPVVGIVCAGDLVQFCQWAAGRSYDNLNASIEIGRVLPPDTLVHGKLANGLALENRIRPVFVGRQFGNYEDRKRRDDVRYILTYVAPCVGYEGDVISDVLAAYPDHSIVMTFEVTETSGGHDRAALIDKFGGQPGQRPAGTGRACD